MFTIIETIIFAVGALSSYLLWRREGNKFNLYCVWLCLAIILGLVTDYLINKISGGYAFSGYFMWALWIAAGAMWVFLITNFSGRNKKNSKIKRGSNGDQVDAYYRAFISKTPAQIHTLKERLGKDGQKLDYSKESLKFVDKLLAEKIEKRPGYQAGLQLADLQGDEGWLIVRLSYYIADFLMRSLGMHWQLNMKKDSLDYSAPVLVLDGTTFELNPMRFVLESGRNGKNVYAWYEQIEKKYKK
jgi:hypothetical protein